MSELFALDAVRGIDDGMIEQAASYRPRKKVWLIAAAAAAVALFIAGGILLTRPDHGAPQPAPSGVYIGIDMNNGKAEGDDPESFSLLSFLIYRREPYVFSQYRPLEGFPLGNKLGRIDTQIYTAKSWSELPDLCGTYIGDFYEIRGFDPAWAVCGVTEGKLAAVFLNRGYRRVTTGADVLETAFSLSDSFNSLTYTAWEDWSFDEHYLLDADCDGAVRDLIRVLDEGIWTEPVTDIEENSAIRSESSYTLSFDIGAMELRIAVYRSGYASVPTVSGSYLSFDANKAQPFFELLDSREHARMLPKTETWRHLRHEELIAFPVYGRFFPKTAPEGFREDSPYALFYTSETWPLGADTERNAKFAACEYRRADDADKWFRLQVCGMDEYAEIVDGVDEELRCDAPIGEVSEENVRTISRGDDEPVLEVMAYDGEICVIVTSNCLTPAEMIETLHRCFDGWS